MPAARFRGPAGVSHANEVAQAAAKEDVVPGCEMVCRDSKRFVKLGDIKLLPVAFVVLKLEVILDPIERIGKEGIFHVRAIAQEIELALRTDSLDLRDSIAKRFERVARRPHEHET